MIAGSIFLIAALVPVLNPAKFELATKQAPLEAQLWIGATLPLALLMLTGAWLLNPKKKKPNQIQKGAQPGGREGCH